MASCLVIGGNGFIGSHLVDALAADGHSVTVFDRAVQPRNYTTAGVREIVGDFMTIDDLRAAMVGQRIVFHFLSTTTPATAEEDPLYDLRTNVVESVSLLRECIDAGVEWFYFASTGGAIYGPTKRRLLSEESPTNPVSPYGIGKLAIENYLRYFQLKHDLRTCALRISNPYGTRQNPSHKQGLIPILLRAVLNDEPVTRFGDGSMVRDYILVDDAVAMIRQMVRRGEPQEPVYNIGSGNGATVNEVFDAVQRVTGHDLRIIERPTPPTYVPHVVLDTSRYVAEFGQPSLLPLEEGIARIWEQMKGEASG